MGGIKPPQSPEEYRYLVPRCSGGGGVFQDRVCSIVARPQHFAKETVIFGTNQLRLSQAHPIRVFAGTGGERVMGDQSDGVPSTVDSSRSRRFRLRHVLVGRPA